MKMHTLEETANAYVVKTENYNAPQVDTINLPNVKVHFGQRNNHAVIKSIEYNKEKYSKEDVQRIIREKLLKCPRCISNRKSRVGEKRMAYVNYMQVGKEVLIAGIGGTIGGAAHFMFLQPQFAGQQIMGIKTSTLVDGIVAFVVAIATKMYAKNVLGQLAGYGVAGTLLAIGLLDQFGLLAPTPAPVARVAPRLWTPTQAVPRASYLAPPGIVVNKHGTVPEMAPGTFG